MAERKVALITGGASGMGLQVAISLSKQDCWDIHILDLNPPSGSQAASSLCNSTFHQCNVTDENSLNNIFQTICNRARSLDFVYANAGIAEHANFYAEHSEYCNQDTTGPVLPIKGMHALVDINLKSVITTSYLALHWMRKTGLGNAADKSLVITTSCGGIYPSYYSPIYTATKYGVVGFMRSIAPYFFHKAGIRANAICLGTAKTNLLSNEEWKNFPDEYFTPVEKIANVVCMLIDWKDNGMGHMGREIGNEKKDILGSVLNGRAIEISGWQHYYREPSAWADEAMEAVMGATNIEALEHGEEVTE